MSSLIAPPRSGNSSARAVAEYILVKLCLARHAPSPSTSPPKPTDVLAGCGRRGSPSVASERTRARLAHPEELTRSVAGGGGALHQEPRWGSRSRRRTRRRARRSQTAGQTLGRVAAPELREDVRGGPSIRSVCPPRPAPTDGEFAQSEFFEAIRRRDLCEQGFEWVAVAARRIDGGLAEGLGREGAREGRGLGADSRPFERWVRERRGSGGGSKSSRAEPWREGFGRALVRLETARAPRGPLAAMTQPEPSASREAGPRRADPLCRNGAAIAEARPPQGGPMPSRQVLGGNSGRPELPRRGLGGDPERPELLE